MATKKVILNGNTIMDVTDTTAVASDVAQGKIFYDADGVRTEGTAQGGGAGASFNDYAKKNVLTKITADDLAGVNITNGGLINYDVLFANQSALETVTLSNSVCYIPYRFFWSCENLTTVNFPTNPVDASNFEISQGAFESCFKLVEITIPSYVTNIHSQAFLYCHKLNTINYGGTQAQWNTISSGANFFSTTNAVVHCTDGDIYFNVPVGNIQVTYADNSVVNVPTAALMGDIISREKDGYKVTGIVIPEGVTEIGTGALMAFDELTSLTLPTTSLTTIADFAIGKNPLLMSVTIPANVTTVGAEFVTAMSNSASITLLPTTPPSGIGNCTFLDDTWQQGTYTIYVPAASLTTYQNACPNVTSSRFQAIV